MDKATRSLLVAALLLLLAEAGLRRLAASPGSFTLPDDRPVALFLGSSRTVRGVRPADVERALHDAGAPAVFVANTAQVGLTTVGLYQTYRDELRHLTAGPRSSPAILLLEVRASALNDHYLQDVERAALEREPLPPLEGAGTAGASTPGWLAALSSGRIEAACGALLDTLLMARGRQTLKALSHRALGGAPAWAAGEKGWLPFATLVAPPERWELMRERYQDLHLKDYALGGVQTQALVLLLREAARDGWRVVLYVLPITEQHRGFFAPGDYQAFRTHLAGVARAEGVPLVELDGDLPLPPSAFYDTHHVNRSAVESVSHALAQRALLPLLR